MVVWAKRRYSYQGHTGDLEKFKTLFDRRPVPGMMMIEAKADHTHHRDVYMALPDRLLLSAFLGYKVIDATEVPLAVNPLVCSGAEFEERFGVTTAPT